VTVQRRTFSYAGSNSTTTTLTNAAGHATSFVRADLRRLAPEQRHQFSADELRRKRRVVVYDGNGYVDYTLDWNNNGLRV
jgi:hypothetical protein